MNQLVEEINYSSLLVNNNYCIAIWGVGYIGFSNLCYFGRNGVKGIGIDKNEQVIQSLVESTDHLVEFDYWLGFNYKYLIEEKMISLTADWSNLAKQNVLAHFVCIPTEKNDEPYMDEAFNVIRSIIEVEKESNVEKPIIIVESTLTPGTAKKLRNMLQSGLKKEFYFGVSPRRDWFLSGDKNLTELARVYGGDSKEAGRKVKEVLSLVCNNLVEAPDYEHAEIVKSVENAFRYLDISFANQLALAFSDLNMREVLRLAGTKWNMNTYYPSLGIGGYCIPLSGKYILDGTLDRSVLTIMEEIISFDRSYSQEICRILLESGIKKIGIMGISYKEDTKVDKSSPAVKILNYLKDNDIDIKVNDPYYTSQEIESRFKASTFNHKNYDEYKDFDAIVMVSAHKDYKLLNRKLLLNNLKNCRVIIDNTGIWQDFYELEENNIKYKLVGAKNWNSLA